MITIKDLELGAIPTGLLEKTRVESSAFQSVGTEIADLPLHGGTIDGIANVESNGVAEGGQKIASGEQRVTHIGANKFVASTVLTEEAFITAAHIRQAITQKQPQAHAKKFDLYVSGLVPVPAFFSNFVSLGDVQEAPISEGVEASVDMDDALGLVANGAVTAGVLTTSMLSYLRRQRVGSTGARVFDITGDANGGTIDGIPFRTIQSPVKLGYFGDFENFYWGTHSLSEEFAFKIKDAGEITDGNGVKHNLTDSNKIALVSEIFQGAAVVDKTNFVKVVPAPAA
jgi:hypothetical protein